MPAIGFEFWNLEPGTESTPKLMPHEPTRMNPAATPPGSRFASRLLAGLLAIAFVAAVAAVTLSGGGCSRAPSTISGDDSTSTEPKGDPWKTAGVRLKKETTFASTQQIMATLTSEI